MTKKYIQKEKSWYQRWDIIMPLILFLISLAVIIAYVITSLNKEKMTPLETIMFQVFILLAGTAGSFIFGKQSAKKAARELIKPHARSAFRRLATLYMSLSRLAMVIEQGKEKISPETNDNVVLGKIEAMVTEQIFTLDDALEDWNDIVPEDVEELVSKLNKTRNDNE